MPIVKGTKQYPVKVVETRPFAGFRSWLLGLLILAAVSYGSYMFGLSQVGGQQDSTRGEVLLVKELLAAEQNKVKDMEQQLANINLGAEVDRQANETVRQEVIVLKEEIAALQEENTFYRGLMAPTQNKSGLSFGSVELSRVDRPRTFGYKVVMQQLATNHQLLNGTLSYTIKGKLESEDVAYDLKELSSQVESTPIKLRFKYFQTIEGELQLPEGFDPVAIELVAKSTGKDPVTVEKRFGWLVEEVN